MMKKVQIIAAAGLFAFGAVAQDVIYTGEGFGTYYYDVEQVEACGADFADQNEGYVECSLSGLTLDQINSDYVVAMNHTQLIGDMALYCGKKVIVTVNGVESTLPLFIGDGCERCGTGSSSNVVWNPNGAPGLDFSYTVLSEFSSNACADGYIDISWSIVDETLYDFDTNAPGSPQGPVAINSGSSSPATSSAATSSGPTTSAAATSSSTGTPTTSSNSPTVAAPSASGSSAPCPTGAWQCSGNVLEECLDDVWTPMVTCAAGSSCEGGDEPYCT